MQLVARALAFALPLTTAVCPGCAPGRRPAPVTEPAASVPAAVAARAETIRRDPLAYLHLVAGKCRALEQYTVMFTRQERRGFGPFKRLHPPERIACKFRRHPFSVYMKWLDPDVKHGESTYVAGQADNQVRFMPRRGLFGLPARVMRVDLLTPVRWGEANYPLTEFGLERMMAQTLANVARAGAALKLAYLGPTRIPEYEGLVHHLRLEFPAWQHETPVQELFTDVYTDLPVCTRILYSSGALGASYVWDKLNPDVELRDEDFLLEAERAGPEVRGGSVTAGDAP